MDFALLFDPLEDELCAELFTDAAYLKESQVYWSEGMPKWEEADIALVGVVDNRGTHRNKGVEKGPDEFRKKFFRLKRGTGPIKIVDLGNLKPGFALEDTRHRLAEVCETLLSHKVFPLVIGTSHDLSFSLCEGVWQETEKQVNLVNVDSRIDVESYGGEEEGFLKGLLEGSLPYGYAHLAHQGYLVEGNVLREVEQRNMELFRLGDLRDDLREAEPVLRGSEVMAFDMSAIRKADAPGHADALPFGLTSEEACKLAWYAGQADKMKVAGFFGYNPRLDAQGQTAWQLAVMVWYFVEGFYQRTDDFRFQSEAYARFTVTIGGASGDLTFYRHARSGKWWVEVDSVHDVIPCSYADYEMALQGSVPDRWVRANARKK